MALYICPVCADLVSDGGIYHCLACDHHYPADAGHICHNCGASLKQHGYKCVKTNLNHDDVARLCDWSKEHGYKRGVWKLFTPDGHEYEGGIQIA